MLTAVSLLRFGPFQNARDPEQGIHHQKKVQGWHGGTGAVPSVVLSVFLYFISIYKNYAIPFFV
jgi:hypothetical protein